MAKHYHWQNNILVLSVYIQPNAKQDEIVGLYDNHLKIKIKAPPIDGKANKQLKKFLALLFSVPVAQIILAKGENTRRKIFHIKAPVKIPNEIKLAAEEKE